MRTTRQVTHHPITVMPGLVPGIHVLARGGEERGWPGQARPCRIVRKNRREETVTDAPPHHRHARPCAGHPRPCWRRRRTWMAGTGPAMTDSAEKSTRRNCHGRTTLSPSCPALCRVSTSLLEAEKNVDGRAYPGLSRPRHCFSGPTGNVPLALREG